MRIIFFLALSVFAIKSSAQKVKQSDSTTGRLEILKKTMDSAALYKVELESEFPGGDRAWNDFLIKNMRYPNDAVKNNIEGVVVVMFIVGKDGEVSNIQVVSGPDEGGLREEAIRIIKRSGKWSPAIQFGKYVKSYKRQPFQFKLKG